VFFKPHPVVVAIVMTLSVHEGHSSMESPVKWDVLYICAPVDKI